MQNSPLFKILLANSAAIGATALLLSMINIITKLIKGVSPLTGEFYSWDYTPAWYLLPYLGFFVFFMVGLLWNKKRLQG